jgi:hypothetical protein
MSATRTAARTRLALAARYPRRIGRVRSRRRRRGDASEVTASPANAPFSRVRIASRAMNAWIGSNCMTWSVRRDRHLLKS